MTIEEKVSIIIRDILGYGLDAIYPEMRLVEDLGITESQANAVYLKLKEYYPNFSLSMTEARKLQTVQDAINVLKEQIKD